MRLILIMMSYLRSSHLLIARFCATQFCLWSNRDLHYAVQPFAKQIVCFAYVLQCKSMRKQRREIDAAMTNNFHQSAHALFAARTQCRHDTMISNAGCECF